MDKTARIKNNEGNFLKGNKRENKKKNKTSTTKKNNLWRNMELQK